MRDHVLVLTSLVVASALGYLACGSPYPARRDAGGSDAFVSQDDAAASTDAAAILDAAPPVDAAAPDDAPTSGT
jgi:hypothetical protein